MFNKLLFCNSRLGLRSRDCPSRSEIRLRRTIWKRLSAERRERKGLRYGFELPRINFTPLLRKLIEFSRSYLNEQLYRTKDRGRIWGIYLWLAAAGKGIHAAAEQLFRK